MDKKTINPSSLLIRLLDRSKYGDYLIVFAIGALPILLAAFIGVHETVISNTGIRHTGYWQQPNVTSLALLLPLILFAFRWVMGKIAPVIEPQLQQHAPPIINILQDSSAKTKHYTELRSCIVSKTNVYLVIIVLVIMALLDLPKLYEMYFANTRPALEKIDWMAMYIVDESVSRSSNLVILGFAYLGQTTAAFFGILVVILFFRHNLYFIRHIYQRRWEHKEKDRPSFQIDVNDVNRCFGFRPTNEAFNTQVKALMIAGVAMFLSRFVYTREDKCPSEGSFTFIPRSSEFCFPEPGQWLMPVIWIIGLAIVAMPSFIKLLPWLSGRGGERVHLSVENYLQEFFTDESWPKKSNGENESTEQVARKFARNSFWPTGDNRARTLFLLSYFIFFIILLPPKSSFEFWQIIIRLVEYAIAAYIVMEATLTFLKWGLRYVDDMLVVNKHHHIQDNQESKDELPTKTDLGIFISYRRRESAPYARSILENLQVHFHRDHLFMDIDNIKPGVRFGQEIDKALDRVDAVIALIGREWATISDDDGKPRIHHAKDMVRYEIATALKQHKRIYPVLVGGATMPNEDDLPEPLKELTHINAVELSDSRWDYDMGVLVEALKINVDK